MEYGEGITRYGFSSSGIGDVDKLVDKNRVLVVVPVTYDDCELLVVAVRLYGRMDNNRCA